MKWNECVGENELFFKSTSTQFNATDTYYVAEDPQPDIDSNDSSVCDFDQMERRFFSDLECSLEDYDEGLTLWIELNVEDTISQFASGDCEYDPITNNSFIIKCDA